MKALSKILLLVAIINTILLTLVLSSCAPDLGDIFNADGEGGLADAPTEMSYSDMYKGYYKSFGDIVLLDQECKDKKYDLEDSFWNEKTVTEFKWDDEDDAVPYEMYIYMAIEVKKDFDMEEFTLFFKLKEGKPSNELVFHIFIVDEYHFDDKEVCQAGEDPWDRDDETGKPLRSPDGTYSLREEYMDLKEQRAVSTASVQVYNNEFTSVTVDKWTVNKSGASYVSIKDGQYILIRFKNNTGFGSFEEMETCEFTMLNLMIKAKDQGIY